MYESAAATITVGATLTGFATQMLGLSMAAERVTETIKQSISGLTGKLSPQMQSALTQTIAILSAMLVVALSHADPLKITDGCTNLFHCDRGWECIIFTGILASGGSAFWNHLLDILKAAKIDKEQTANANLAAAKQQPIPG